MKRFFIYLFLINLFIDNSFSVTVRDCSEYLSRRDRDNAIKCGNQLVSENNKNDMIYVFRSTIYSSFNEANLAIDDLNYAIKLNPNNINAYTLRFSIFIEQEKNLQALNDLNTVISLDKRGKNSFTGSLYQQRASVNFKLKYQNQAITDYETSISYFNKMMQNEVVDDIKNQLFYDSYYGICTIYINTSSFSNAINSCKKAIEYNQNSVEAIINLSSAYIEINDNLSAIKLLESKKGILSKSFIYNYNLALANLRLYRQTKREEYRENFAKIQEIAKGLAKSKSDNKLLENLN